MEVPPSPNEIIFGDLYWSCAMGCSVSINNFYSFIPFGKPFKVFLKKASETAWKEVVHESEWADHIKYVYGLYKTVFGFNHEQGKIDIKVVY